MIRPAAPARWAVARSLVSAALAAAAAATPAVTAAQPSTPARPASAADPADPTDPAARVPALRHDSVLAARRGVAAAPRPVPWQEANEQVNRVGGWRVYLRESAPGAAPGTNGDTKVDANGQPNPGTPAGSTPTPASPSPRTGARP